MISSEVPRGALGKDTAFLIWYCLWWIRARTRRPTMLLSFSATQYLRCSKSSQGWKKSVSGKKILDKQPQWETTSTTHGSNLDTGFALLPIGNALLNLTLHRIGPLAGLDLAHSDVLTLGAAQILLEILDIRPSS